MFVYTVKLLVNNDFKSDFIKYLYEKHLPDVVATGCFLNSSLEVDTEKDEIIARYTCETEELFKNYLLKYADEMRNDVIQLFPVAIINAQRNFCKVVAKSE